MDISKMTAAELSAAVKDGRTSCREAAELCLSRIKEMDGDINAFITVRPAEEVLAEADSIDERIKAGELKGPMAGVPIAVKDNICVEGLPATCASKILGNFVPQYTAEAARRVKDAGMLILGKTNMDEFAMGSTTETSYFGPTKNPVDTARVPGGSSGGSAAAVAAGMCFAALGSDTGGSIRQPASYCGAVGLKPTYGTVSRYGLIAYGSSLDQIGPITKDVRDAKLLLGILAGKDDKDSTSLPRRDLANIGGALPLPMAGLKVGLPKAYFGEGLNGEVRESVLAAAESFSKMGAKVEYFDLDLVDYAVPCYYTIADAEASSNLERFDGVKYGYRAEGYEGLHDMYKKTRSEGFGSEVKRRIMLGSFILSTGYYDAYYLKALRVRRLIKDAYDKAFSKYDIILGPVSPHTAPLLGTSLDDPIQMYLSDIYTVPANLAAIPAVSVPCGTDKAGLPIGLQLSAGCMKEALLLGAAQAFERVRKEER